MSMIIDGTNGLTFNNSTTQASAGVVLQVVNTSFNTYVTTTSASFVDTGLSASITPKFSTSKVLVIVALNGITDVTASTWNFSLNDASNTLIANLINYNTNVTLQGYTSSYLLSPATTSSLTYKVRFNSSGGVVLRLNDSATTSSASSITLMEIA